MRYLVQVEYFLNGRWFIDAADTAEFDDREEAAAHAYLATAGYKKSEARYTIWRAETKEV